MCHAPLSMEFSRQEYWIGLPFPAPEDLPDPGTEPMFPTLAGRFFTSASPGKQRVNYSNIVNKAPDGEICKKEATIFSNHQAFIGAHK